MKWILCFLLFVFPLKAFGVFSIQVYSCRPASHYFKNPFYFLQWIVMENVTNFPPDRGGNAVFQSGDNADVFSSKLDSWKNTNYCFFSSSLWAFWKSSIFMSRSPLVTFFLPLSFLLFNCAHVPSLGSPSTFSFLSQLHYINERTAALHTITSFPMFSLIKLAVVTQAGVSSLTTHESQVSARWRFFLLSFPLTRSSSPFFLSYVFLTR